VTGKIDTYSKKARLSIDRTTAIRKGGFGCKEEVSIDLWGIRERKLNSGSFSMEAGKIGCASLGKKNKTNF